MIRQRTETHTLGTRSAEASADVSFDPPGRGMLCFC
jgi:hypothetical protein